MTTPVYESDNLELGPCTVYIEEDGQDASVGIIGDVTVNMGAGASPLTGAHMGDVALNKVITGGHFRFTVQFKEITLENFARAFPNCVLTGDGDRVDFMPRVGLSLRSIAKKMTIKQIVGGVETTDDAKILIIPEASPVEGEITLGYTATEQRVLAATFEAWPDDTTSRWSYIGDELAS